jgi:lipoate-protein ligase B
MWSVSIRRTCAEHPFSFSDLIKLQSERLEVLNQFQESELLFAEVNPTVTLGARQVYHEPELAERFKRSGVDVVSGERGGNETWHGPGQWIGFVLTPLAEYTGDPRGVRKAVHQTLHLLEPLLQSYLPSIHFEDGDRLGLWSDRGKVVSIGIKIRGHYTSSGFAVNCIPNPNAFLGLNPCGIGGAQPDFLFRDFRDDPERLEREFVNLPNKILRIFQERSS